ncbi:hypothetical protein [Ornithobacterium rhinotracheale]|uniref:hypothetical protein n=1 Tax=Ornithobacterium rhinotracheale TaxID=28251 RepID=UPI0040368BC8
MNSHTKKKKVTVPLVISSDVNLHVTFDKLGFLADVVADLAQEVSGSVYDAQKLKFHLKALKAEAEKKVDEHFDVYKQSKRGEIVPEMSGEVVYIHIAKAYNFIMSKAPHEVLSIAKTIQILEERGIDYTQVCFEPENIKE